MGTVALKLLLTVFMGIVPFCFGILPIKILDWLIRRNGYSHGVRTLISVFTCFAGGVILGVSLIELFPEAREGLSELSERHALYGAYPFVELFVGVGFLLVYFVEEFISILLGHNHQHADHIDEIVASANRRDDVIGEDAKCPGAACCDANTSSHLGAIAECPASARNSDGSSKRKVKDAEDRMGAHFGASDAGGALAEDAVAAAAAGRVSDSQQGLYPKDHQHRGFRARLSHSFSVSASAPRAPRADGGDDDDDAESCGEGDCAAHDERRKAVVGAVTLVVALFVHTSLEGFAFGIQKDVISVGSLFFGIIVHKVLVFFSVGINLTQALPHNPRIVVALIALLAAFSPIGALAGVIVEGAEMNGDLKGTVSTILTCLSIGTFFYIALFEILAPERQKPVHKLLQWLGCALGFTVMTVVLSLAGHENVSGQHSHR